MSSVSVAAKASRQVFFTNEKVFYTNLLISKANKNVGYNTKSLAGLKKSSTDRACQICCTPYSFGSVGVWFGEKGRLRLLGLCGCYSSDEKFHWAYFYKIAITAGLQQLEDSFRSPFIGLYLTLYHARER